MKELFASASFAGAALTMVAFFAGSAIKDKFKSQIFNPILIAIVTIITFLLTTGIDYDTYNAGAKYISWFLTPATVSLAIPLYRQIEQLKNNVFASLAGIFSGVVASAVGILVLAVLFGMRKKWGPYRLGGHSAPFWAAVLSLTAPIMIGCLAALDFNRAFTVFHTIFFPGKTNWVFDWYADQIIRVLPQEFFRNCAIVIGAGLIAMAGGILIWEGRKKK